MRISRWLAALLLAPAVLAACGCTINGRGSGRPITFDGGQVVVDGCLVRNPNGTMVFSLVKVISATAAQGSAGTNAVATRIGLSTSLDGPWVGTRVLELVPDPSVNVTQYGGHVFRASGVIESDTGTTGSVDQVKTERGVGFIRLHVQSVHSGEGQCAN